MQTLPLKMSRFHFLVQIDEECSEMNEKSIFGLFLVKDTLKNSRHQFLVQIVAQCSETNAISIFRFLQLLVNQDTANIFIQIGQKKYFWSFDIFQF